MKQNISKEIVYLPLFLLSTEVVAADTALAGSGIISISQVLGLLLGLLVVLSIFLVLAFLLKRVSGIKGFSKGHLEIIDTIHLGSKEKIMVVRVAENYVLLGVSSSGIALLDTLDGQSVCESESTGQATPGFAQLLSSAGITRG